MKNRGLCLCATALLFLIFAFVPCDLLAQNDGVVRCCYNKIDYKPVEIDFVQTTLRNMELDRIQTRISRYPATAVRTELLAVGTPEALAAKRPSVDASLPYDKRNLPGLDPRISQPSLWSMLMGIPNRSR
jgi:hypothetical protein